MGSQRVGHDLSDSAEKEERVPHQSVTSWIVGEGGTWSWPGGSVSCGRDRSIPHARCLTLKNRWRAFYLAL